MISTVELNSEPDRNLHAIHHFAFELQVLKDISQAVNTMFLTALCEAIEHHPEHFQREVAAVVRNRMKGGSLFKENQEIVQWMEQFRPKVVDRTPEPYKRIYPTSSTNQPTSEP